MTTILQQMQTGPAGAGAIFVKLLDTSATAAGTRGRLLWRILQSFPAIRR